MNNILLLFSHYRTPKDMGGLRSWHIGTKLVKMGFNVTAIVPGIDTLTGVKKQKMKIFRMWSSDHIDGVNITWVNSARNDRSVKWRRALYYLSYSFLQCIFALFQRKIDVVITMSIPISSILVGFCVARLRGAQFVIDVRDLPTDLAIELGYFKNGFVSRCILKLEDTLYRHADLLIAVSKGMAQLLVSKGIDEHKINVIPIGYDGYVFSPMIQWHRNIKAEVGIENKFTVLYAGTMGYVIDIETVIDAARQTKDFTDIVYLFVGDGQRLDEYIKISEQNGLNCIFLGRKPKLDIPLYCTQADLCVYPLTSGKVISTLLGNKIYDYLGSGTPILYTGPQGDARDLIKSAQAGLCFDAGDSKSLADGIIGLYNDRGRLQQLGNNAFDFIHREYRVDKMMDLLGEAISNGLKSSSVHQT